MQQVNIAGGDVAVELATDVTVVAENGKKACITCSYIIMYV